MRAATLTSTQRINNAADEWWQVLLTADRRILRIRGGDCGAAERTAEVNWTAAVPTGHDQRQVCRRQGGELG